MIRLNKSGNYYKYYWLIYLVLGIITGSNCLAQDLYPKHCGVPFDLNENMEFMESGLKPKLFAPGIVSTVNYNDRDLMISPDGKQFYFSRSQTAKSDDYNYDILFVEKKNGVWTEPQLAWFSSNYGEVEAFFNPEGTELYFNSNRPFNGTEESLHWETWVTRKVGEEWETPKPLGYPFERTCYTTFSNNGRMYYTKEDQRRLYRANYKNGKFGEPEKLDTTINSMSIQYNAFIAADESFLIFTRPVSEESNNMDLYISFRNEQDEWSKPQNLGSEINSTGTETCPSISPDGKHLFFSSDRRGNFDIYWVDIMILDQFRHRKSYG